MVESVRKIVCRTLQQHHFYFHSILSIYKVLHVDESISAYGANRLQLRKLELESINDDCYGESAFEVTIRPSRLYHVVSVCHPFFRYSTTMTN